MDQASLRVQSLDTQQSLVSSFHKTFKTDILSRKIDRVSLSVFYQKGSISRPKYVIGRLDIVQYSRDSWKKTIEEDYFSILTTRLTGNVYFDFGWGLLYRVFLNTIIFHISV